jgi:hypothetical protein
MAFALDRGGLSMHITDLFLFDAFYGNHDYFRSFLNNSTAAFSAAYTNHLAGEHTEFVKSTPAHQRSRLHFTPTNVDHEEVVQKFLAEWLAGLDAEWKAK